MYAVIQAGGKQYRVAPGDTVRIDTLNVEVGAEIELNGVLAVADDEGRVVTGSDVSGAKVLATVAGHGRGDKVLVFKFRRKKQYKKTIGHRQNYTELTVNQVLI
jgi:large subunit ribosomal protein L21